MTKIDNPLHRATLTKLRTNSFNYTSYDSDETYCPKCTLREKDDLAHWLLRCTNNQLIQPRNNLLRLLRLALKANNYSNPLKDLLNCNFPNTDITIINDLYKHLHRFFVIQERISKETRTNLNL